jgi:hypothetical protein
VSATPDPFANHLCAWCSVTCGDLCSRCAELVKSGKNKGVLPYVELPRADSPRSCTICRGERPSDGGTVRFCDACRMRSVRRRHGREGDPWNEAPQPKTLRARSIESLWVK